jgi:hypothetical protein
MKLFTQIVIILALASAPLSLYAQEQAKDQEHAHGEATPSVPELDKFHEILHPLVHDAYPNNDFAAIKKALPKLVKSATAMTKVSLPKELAASRADYKKASKKLVQQLRSLEKSKTRLADKEFGEQFMEMHDTFEGIMGMVR